MRPGRCAISTPGPAISRPSSLAIRTPRPGAERSPGRRLQSALWALSLANIFAVVIVDKLVDDAASSVPGAGIASRRIGADVDDDRRAVADDDRLRGPS